jgi:hypothetical protein
MDNIWGMDPGTVWHTVGTATTIFATKQPGNEILIGDNPLDTIGGNNLDILGEGPIRNIRVGGFFLKGWGPVVVK